MPTDNDEPTCGKGLAANAALPERLAAVIAALADNLAAHLPSLDPTDAAARAEHDVYTALVRGQREAAVALTATARRMAGARALPMGRHDEALLAQPAVRAAFARFVAAKRALAELLAASAGEDAEMLEEMRKAGALPP